MKKLILTLCSLTSIAIANPNESLPITSNFNLPKNMDLTAYKTMTTLINPKNNSMELSIFSIKGGMANFTGHIVTSNSSKLQIESESINYFPINRNSFPNTCNFNTNGTISCFHPNSLIIEDNNIKYQLGSTMVESKIDIGIMGASIKFFAATEFESNGIPSKYLGISNDTYKQQLSWITCDLQLSCKQNKIKVKPTAKTISNFQILNNKLYFVVNYNTLITVDILDNSYKTKELDVYNASAFVLDKDANLYVMNSINNIIDNKPGSFAISKCIVNNGKCNVIYTENTNPFRYSRLFMGIDNHSIYLLANKDNGMLTLNSNLTLVAVPKK